MDILEHSFISHPTELKLCLEINPPRGTDLASTIEKIRPVLDKIDFLNVTDCALAKMKAAALPCAAKIKAETGKEVVVNVACRDRNLLALQADLLASWISGVKGIVALTGDAMSVGDSPERKGVFEVNSVGLLQTIAQLNAGKDANGHELKGSTNFLAGCVCNPNAKNTEVEVRRLNKKAAAGAKFSLSQPVFDTGTSDKFFSLASQSEVDLFVGLMPIKNRKMLDAVSSIPGIKLGQDFIDRTSSMGDSEIAEFSISYALELANNLKGYVTGFHVISGGYPSLANELVLELSKICRADPT